MGTRASQSRSKGSRLHCSSHSAKSTSSLRLETATKAAELAVRLKYYQKETEANRIKLEKDFKITQATLRVIEEEQQSQESPSQLPEEDPHERIQSFLGAMPTADAPMPQPAPPSTLTLVYTALATIAQFQGAADLGSIHSQHMVSTDAVTAPLSPTSYVIVVTTPEQLTNMMASRPTVTVPTSVSITTTSFITSHSRAAATVARQMVHSLPQPWGYGTSFLPSHQQVTQSVQHLL